VRPVALELRAGRRCLALRWPAWSTGSCSCRAGRRGGCRRPVVELSERGAALVIDPAAVSVLVVYPVAFETLAARPHRRQGGMGCGRARRRRPIGFRHALAAGPVRSLPRAAGLPSSSPACHAAAQPRDKRVGDLLAGTVVLQERVASRGGQVAQMPPQLAGWAAGPRPVGVDRRPRAVGAPVRQPLARPDAGRARRPRWPPAHAVLAAVRPPPPPGTPGWAVLAAVLAERRRREQSRVASAYGGGGQSGGATGYGRRPTGRRRTGRRRTGHQAGTRQRLRRPPRLLTTLRRRQGPAASSLRSEPDRLQCMRLRVRRRGAAGATVVVGTSTPRSSTTTTPKLRRPACTQRSRAAPDRQDVSHP
jgi:hypothetical protein